MGDVVASPDTTHQALIDLAVDSWKFSRLFARVTSKLDAGTPAFKSLEADIRAILDSDAKIPGRPRCCALGPM